MSVYKIAGELIVASRLKRLSEKFLSDVSKVYKSEELPFETSYFPVFYLLDLYGTLKISDVAQELEITQSGASQMVNALVKKGLIRYVKDKGDKRIRTISFTTFGAELLNEIKPIWKSIQNSYRALLEEGDNSRYFFQALEEIEDNSTRKNLFTRVSEELRIKRMLRDIRFIPFDDSLEAEYKDLSLSWLLDNNFSDNGETDYINQIGKMVKSGQGVVEMATAKEKVTGAYFASIADNAARIKIFAVSETCQHQDLEKALISRLIQTLKAKQIDSVSITINRRLAPLIKLFRSAGFSFVCLEQNRSGETGVVLTKTYEQ